MSHADDRRQRSSDRQLLHIRSFDAISAPMTVSELQDLLVATLARHSGGTQRRWRLVVGPVRLFDAETHPHCNWAVDPSGGTRETDEVERLLDQVRLAHPLVMAD